MMGLSKIAVIVGEDDALRVELARFLAAFDIDSVMVGDAEQIVDCLDGHEPDLVLVTSNEYARDDVLVRLPDTVDRCRRAGAALMVCASGGDAGTLSLAVASGVDECLVAPFDAELLRFKLEQTGVLGIQ